VRRDKVITLLVGFAAIATSFLMDKVTGNTLEVTTRTNHVFAAPLFGLFVMAMFVPFATPLGAIVGTLAGCIVAILFAYWDLITGGPTLSFQWITLIALIVNLLVGIPVSLILPRKNAVPRVS
jgi:Na+/proline symporter